MNENMLDRRLKSAAVDGSVHVMHRPINSAEDGQLDTTFAYIIEEVQTDGSPELRVVYEVARKNPKDNFCRRIGRLIAKGRLNHPESFSEGFPIRKVPKNAAHWRALDEMVVEHYLYTDYKETSR